MNSFKAILFSILLSVPALCLGDYLIVGRSATLKTEPNRDAQINAHLEDGDVLELLEGSKTNGYYHARISNSTTTGWIYQTLVRRYLGGTPTNTGSNDNLFPAFNLDYVMPAAETGDVIIAHEGYTSCISTQFLVPKWVAHQVSDQLLQGDARRDGSSYPSDNAFPNLKANAYALSGYDHGHLAPAGDFKRSDNLMNESFYMINMSPQHGCMNQKGWCVLESNVRHWARQNPGSMFYVFSGAVLDEFIDSLCIDNATTVYVPAQFYKIVIEQTSTGQVQSAGFLVANSDVPFNDLPGGRVSIDEIESIIGINFMPHLTQAQESQIESVFFAYELQDLPECTGRNRTCESIYGNRKKPENRTTLLCR